MSLLTISIILPTVTGREDHLARCLDAYERTCKGVTHEVIVLRDLETCGLGWIAGAKRAKGKYLHFTADDLVPHDGWWIAAAKSVRDGNYPAPILNQGSKGVSCGQHWNVLPFDGQEVDVSGVPFMSRAQHDLIGPSLAIHYYTDNYFSHRARQHSIPTVACHGYRLDHNWAQVKRGAGMTENDRMSHDRAVYEQTIGCSA